MRAAYLALIVAAGVLVSVAYARQAASVVDNTAPEDAPADDSSSSDSSTAIDDAASALDNSNPFAQMEQNNMSQSAEDANCAAFLAMLRHSEGTDQQPDPYAVCYHYAHTVQDFSDHPANTGEWKGERLTDQQCIGAGLNPGCVSTAAGAYQLIRPTWNGCKRALALPDFSPESQDKAALYLIQQRGALDDVKAGRFDDAVAKCSKTATRPAEWASLPGANYAGQGMRSMDALRVAYTEAGGVFA